MTIEEKQSVTGTGIQTGPKDLIILKRPEIAKGDTITVKIPDLLVSILEKPRNLNPLLDKTLDMDDWVCKLLGFDERLSKEWVNMRFPLLCASMIPNSSEQPLRGYNEWVAWAFPFDDRIDGGDLANDLDGAAAEIIETLAIMDDDHPIIDPEVNGIRHIFQKLWLRISKYAPPDERRRYKRLNREYMLGLLQQIKWLGYKDRVLTIDEYLAFRRPSSGVGPTCLFAEWSVTESNKIPCEVVEHPSVEIFRYLVMDIVAISNDIYSCPKDIPNGEGSSTVCILLKQGYSLQEAIDEAGKMVIDRYKMWEQAVRDLPSWGEEIDAVVLKLIQAYSDVCWGDTMWSFQTARYMGAEKEQARATGMLTFAVKDVEKAARVPQSS
ncbi:hypothetical protein TWF106_008169 [Orbilia oligospora]|uniref:Terpene synthase n=1 Tax=Orbilia oligospora TaxID=2813651 RepID=A0A7C8UN50_ORBOL|nr:hypothetical protein TWF106_008169 [Orbilia oligospora]